MANTSILMGRFRYVRTKELVFLMAVYGPSTTGDKIHFLKKLMETKQIIDDSLWVVGDDFNLIRSLEDKKEGVRRLDQ